MNREFVKYSYSSANVLPMKIFLNFSLMKSILLDRKIIPIHLQLNPTNKCNWKCDFCSCSNRDKSIEMDIEDIEKIINILKKWIKSVTITGGGEPTIYNSFYDMIDLFHKNRIDIGLVTNGSLIGKIDNRFLRKIRWIRISLSDDIDENLKKINMNLNDYFGLLKYKFGFNERVAWSFSYVLSDDPNIDLIAECINIVHKHNLTHMRIVSDILNSEKVYPHMKNIREIFSCVGDNKIIFQDRNEYTKGFKTCYISILKPVIGADGYIYPCCGTQYALENPGRDYEVKMRMGKYEDLKEIIDEQKFYDGSSCVKCYYSDYNLVLGILLNGLDHWRFV